MLRNDFFYQRNKISFKDKVILITVSTSGIGQEIAKKLLEDDANVIINYAHNENNADEIR